MMNAGTRLGEMKDSVKAVRFVNMKGDVMELPAASIPFEYRRAHLPKGIVVGVWLQLRQGARAEIEKVVKDYLHYRTGHPASGHAQRRLRVQKPPQ